MVNFYFPDTVGFMAAIDPIFTAEFILHSLRSGFHGRTGIDSACTLTSINSGLTESSVLLSAGTVNICPLHRPFSISQLSIWRQFSLIHRVVYIAARILVCLSAQITLRQLIPDPVISPGQISFKIIRLFTVRSMLSIEIINITELVIEIRIKIDNISVLNFILDAAAYFSLRILKNLC